MVRIREQKHCGKFLGNDIFSYCIETLYCTSVYNMYFLTCILKCIYYSEPLQYVVFFFFQICEITAKINAKNITSYCSLNLNICSLSFYVILVSLYFRLNRTYAAWPKKKLPHNLIFRWTAFSYDCGTHLLWHCFDKLLQCHKIYFCPVLH